MLSTCASWIESMSECKNLGNFPHTPSLSLPHEKFFVLMQYCIYSSLTTFSLYSRFPHFFAQMLSSLVVLCLKVVMSSSFFVFSFQQIFIFYFLFLDTYCNFSAIGIYWSSLKNDVCRCSIWGMQEHVEHMNIRIFQININVLHLCVLFKADSKLFSKCSSTLRNSILDSTQNLKLIAEFKQTSTNHSLQQFFFFPDCIWTEKITCIYYRHHDIISMP